MSPAPQLIVAIDDDALVRSLLEFKLGAKGYRVRTAPDGESGLALMAGERPDLVVLDAMLGSTPDGFEVLRRIRETPALDGVPVVMLTSRNRQDDVVGALQLGASDYVTKPFMPEELAARVARLIGVRARSAA